MCDKANMENVLEWKYLQCIQAAFVMSGTPVPVVLYISTSIVLNLGSEKVELVKRGFYPHGKRDRLNNPFSH